MTKIIPPTHCPSCDSVLELVNEQLFCRNHDCPAQWDKKVINFASTLKIKGLGPATVSKLFLEKYSDLYELTKEEISELLDSEKLGEKLYIEIQKSREIALVSGQSLPHGHGWIIGAQVRQGGVHIGGRRINGLAMLRIRNIK